MTSSKILSSTIPTVRRSELRTCSGHTTPRERRISKTGSMAELFNSFISKTFLRSVWGLEFEAFRGSSEESALEERLRRWAARKDLRERSAEAAFIEEFFHDTWGYAQTGQQGAEGGSFTLWPQF